MSDVQIRCEGTKIYVEIDTRFMRGKDMLSIEDDIQKIVNEVGLTATETALKQFDTDGEAIVLRDTRYTSKGLQKKK